MELLSFSQFINEGAYLGKDDLVHLQYDDDKNNPDEILKTGDSGRSHFKGTSISAQAQYSPYKWEWPIFWGMGPNGISPEIDHPGRIKYTMDKLKKADIADLGPSLNDFIRTSFSRLGITGNFRPDYVVTVGSTAGLVNAMANAINFTLGSDVQVIELPKVVYFDAYDAFDWDEVNDQVKRNGERTFKKVKSTIYNYVDPDETPNEIKMEIKDSQTVDDLKRVLARVGVKWKEVVAGENVKPFIVRSSGRTAGGTRSMWKNKYDYETNSFIEAVIDCAVNGSRMLIIDDNKHTGTDMNDIRRNIQEIVSKLDKVRANPDNRFAFYVLYRMPSDKKYTDFKGNTKEMQLTTDVVQDFKNFLRGGRLDSQTEDNLDDLLDK